MLDIKKYPQYLSDPCKLCMKCNVAKETKRDKGEVIYKAGQFVVNCLGIPKDWNAFIKEQILEPGQFELFSPEEQSEMIGLYDISYWAEHTLFPDYGKWQPRGAIEENMVKYGLSKEAPYYQWLLLNCTAVKKAVRIGRRAGKSFSLTLKALHGLMVNKNYKIVLVCPYKSQIELVFKSIDELLQISPKLRGAIKHKKMNPYPEIMLHNGSTLLGFTSGSKSGTGANTLRGQPASEIFLDEASYLHPDDMGSIAGIMMDRPNVKLWASSTPSGARDRFYGYFQNPTYRSFHFPSMVNPNWNYEMELEMKEQFTVNEYEHEVKAEHGEESTGVFQKTYIDAALRDYMYDTQKEVPGWVYSLGVDWNPTAGTRISVVGARMEIVNGIEKTIFRQVEKGVVDLAGWSEIKSVAEIVKLHRKWKPFSIYLDKGGGGSLAVQLLHQVGAAAISKKEHPYDAFLLKIVRGLDMGSSIETIDPWTKEKIDRPLKPFTISNAARQFEQGRMEISSHDKSLRQQLENYVVLRVTPSGQPVYGSREEKIGDHDLDALTFALLAFTMEKTQIGKIRHAASLGILPDFKPGKDMDDEEREYTAKAIAEVKKAAQRSNEKSRTAKMEGTGNKSISYVSWNQKSHSRSAGLNRLGSGRSNI